MEITGEWSKEVKYSVTFPTTTPATRPMTTHPNMRRPSTHGKSHSQKIMAKIVKAAPAV